VTAGPEGLVDIGANLTHKTFDGDLDQVLARAAAAGVHRMVVTGADIASSRAALALASAHPDRLRSTAGVHPHHAKDCDAHTLAAIEELAARPEVVAIGECGLDFNRNFSPQETQVDWFQAQVELAIRLGLPLFLHERDASAAFLEVLRPRRARLPSMPTCRSTSTSGSPGGSAMSAAATTCASWSPAFRSTG
jgi:TatD DNase family protein